MINTNLIGTVVFIAGLIGTVAEKVGCTTVGDITNCSASMIPQPWGTYIGLAVSGIGIFLKFFKPGGTLVQKLTSPTVVVTPESKPGTVTPSQVHAA